MIKKNHYSSRFYNDNLYTVQLDYVICQLKTLYKKGLF